MLSVTLFTTEVNWIAIGLILGFGVPALIISIWALIYYFIKRDGSWIKPKKENKKSKSTNKSNK